MEPKKNFNRDIAVKAAISTILNGQLRPEDEQGRSYLLVETGEKIQRLNILATILGIESQGLITTLYLDDGTGKIALRFFEETEFRFEIGQSLLIIARPRSYNQEKYLAPEIVKLIDPAWLKVRALELKQLIPAALNLIEDSKWMKDEENSEGVIEEVEEEVTLPAEKVINLIKMNDTGDGVMIETILEKSHLNDTEQIIKRMLERGEIFQNAPGKVKIL